MSNQYMNSKVDENKDEDEDVIAVVATSIITPTNITTNTTTIRQQDHLRALHIVSRWDANYTKKRYNSTHIVSRWDANYTKKRDINTNDDNDGFSFDPENHPHRPRYSHNKRSSSILDYCNHNNNNSNIYDDRPPISPVRRRTRKQHRITVAPVA
jgi:hypothetical protein